MLPPNKSRVCAIVWRCVLVLQPAAFQIQPICVQLPVHVVVVLPALLLHVRWLRWMLPETGVPTRSFHPDVSMPTHAPVQAARRDRVYLASVRSRPTHVRLRLIDGEGAGPHDYFPASRAEWATRGSTLRVPLQPSLDW